MGEHVESLSSDWFTQKYSGTAVGRICDTVEWFCFIISVAGFSRPDTGCFFSVTEGERALKQQPKISAALFFLSTVRNFQFSQHSILETGSEGNFFQKPVTKTVSNWTVRSWISVAAVGVKSAFRNFVFEETLRRWIMSEVTVFILVQCCQKYLVLVNV
jgi:hypothetical protein